MQPTISDFEIIQLYALLSGMRNSLNGVRWAIYHETINPEPWRELVSLVRAVSEEAQHVEDTLLNHCGVIGHPPGSPTHIKNESITE